MNAAQAVIDLDDTEGLLAADRDGLLRAASMGGAHVRATAAALDEGALHSLRGDLPRTVIWVAGRGTAETAGTMLAATSGGAPTPIVIAADAPPWIGALDMLVVADRSPLIYLSRVPSPSLRADPRPTSRVETCGRARTGPQPFQAPLRPPSPSGSECRRKRARFSFPRARR